jgi:hypothetical protein
VLDKKRQKESDPKEKKGKMKMKKKEKTKSPQGERTIRFGGNSQSNPGFTLPIR